jgi:putative hemolysin
VMTPRTEMAALDADATVEAAADAVAEFGRSRYPVFTESLDEVVGVVHAKDILKALRETPGAPVRSVMRQPIFVPGTREVEEVLADMKHLKTHMAVVLDEYGGTAGLVTMEDLLEEIVGNILDEHDAEDLAQAVAEDGSVTIDGSLPLTEFNADFDADLDDTDYTTIGGFLFGQLGRLPKVGDLITVGLHRFEIVSMAGRRVDRIRVRAADAGVEPRSSE